jgi:hypothetical protein
MAEEMKYRIGQEVVIVDNKESYPIYIDWADDNKLCLADEKVKKLWTKYIDKKHNDCEVGTRLIIIATGYHKKSHVAMYLCEDSNGNPVLIGEDGIDTLENEGTRALNRIVELEKQIIELKSVAEFQQSSNINRYFENKKLKEVLTVGTTFNKALNSRNRVLEEEVDRYRNMVFDKIAMLDKAKEIIEKLISQNRKLWIYSDVREEAEQFIEEVK